MRKMHYSGDDNIGMIPKEWDYPRLKFHCTIKNGSDPVTEGSIPAYGSGREPVKFCGEYKEGPAVLLGRKGTLDNPRYVEGKFWNVDTAMDAYPKNHYIPKYFYYTTTILDINKYATNTAKPSMTQADYYNMVIPFPSEEEQIAIVEYIDDTCAKIDEAISKHKQIIEKLEEYRKCLISRVVLHGLYEDIEENKNDILGSYPSHWRISRLKFAVSIVRGGSPRPIENYITDHDGYNWIKIGDATGNGKYINSTKQKIIKDGLSKTRFVLPGTLLLTNSMSFGHPYILSIDGCIHDGWLAFSNYRGIVRDYLYYYLMSESAMNQFVKTVEGSVVNNLNIEKVRNSLVALPPIEEQIELTDYLDKQNKSIDDAIMYEELLVSRLEEYRKSIINNAVTGKIDCRTRRPSDVI